MLILIPFLGLPALALASPHPGPRSVSVDTSVYCGQYDTIDSGIEYSILLDQWGAAGATSGESCAYISNVGTDTISWVTNFTWTGGTGVKSFTDCQLNDGINQQLSAISSMPVSPLLTIMCIRACYQLICDFPLQTTWSWSLSTTDGIVADVAYDMFTSTSSGGSAANEIMIWLANINAGPISSSYGSDGEPTPIASELSIASHTW